VAMKRDRDGLRPENIAVSYNVAAVRVNMSG